MEHDAFMAGEVGRVEVDAKGPDTSQGGIADFMLGTYAAEKMREITRRSEERLSERERDPGGRRDR
jgi:hypothetical protein